MAPPNNRHCAQNYIRYRIYRLLAAPFPRRSSCYPNRPQRHMFSSCVPQPVNLTRNTFNTTKRHEARGNTQQLIALHYHTGAVYCGAARKPCSKRRTSSFHQSLPLVSALHIFPFLCRKPCCLGRLPAPSYSTWLSAKKPSR